MSHWYLYFHTFMSSRMHLIILLLAFFSFSIYALQKELSKKRMMVKKVKKNLQKELSASDKMEHKLEKDIEDLEKTGIYPILLAKKPLTFGILFLYCLLDMILHMLK